MKWTSVYLMGYIILICGLLTAFWKWGILIRIGPTWTVIGLVIAMGIGIMLTVANRGVRENRENIIRMPRNSRN